jgi:GT2 family glycosyltransferase
VKRIEFPFHEQPRVSILILAWRQRGLLEACLQALRGSTKGAVPCEVIISLNGAAPDVEAFVRQGTEGARIVESSVNLGFGGGNNRAAHFARGEYLVLLNDDAIVQPEWLEWLVSTADANPRAGAVGSCVLFPDGRVQEAGSILWNDGSTMPVARGMPGDSLEWHFVRPVDYASACSLLVRRTTWDAVGGFDENYFPAYYEDVDLSLAIQARGERVLYEPRSRVCHHESASSDETFKHFLFDRNRRRLVEKWHDDLGFHEAAAPWSAAAVSRAAWRARKCPRRILVVDDRVPARSMGAGFGRMFDALLELANAGYAASIFPTCAVDLPNDALVSNGVAVVTARLSEHLARPDVFYDAVIVSRPHNYDQVAPLVRRHQPWATLLYDVEALYWRRLERQATLVLNEAEAERLLRDARAIRLVEERILRESDYAVAVSCDEARTLEFLEGRCPIDVLPPSEPNVVCTESPFWARRGVAFVAGWLAGATSPNGDGLTWFVAEVLPHLRRMLPWVYLRVTGADPPAEIRALADPNVHFEGHVQRLDLFYDEVRVVIVPIRYGAGVKLKTVEALQHGVPVVSTTIGAEGLETRGLEAIDVADDPEQFAERVAVLLTDRHVWERRRETIAELVQSWRELQEGQTWTGALEKALSRRTWRLPGTRTISISTN